MRIIKIYFFLTLIILSGKIHAQNKIIYEIIAKKNIEKAQYFLDNYNKDSVNIYCTEVEKYLQRYTDIKITKEVHIIKLNNLLYQKDYPKFRLLLKKYRNILTDTIYRINLLKLEGDYYYKTSQADSCFKYYKKAYIDSKETDDIKIKISCLNAMSNYYRKNNNPTKALNYDLEESKLLKKTNNLLLYITNYKNIGNAFSYDKNYIKAREYYKKALFISEETNNSKFKATLLNNIGTTYNTINQTKICNSYYKQSIKLSIKNNDFNLLAVTYRNISNVYLKNKSIDSSKYYIKLALEAYKHNKYKNKKNYIHTIKTLAEIYIYEEKYDEALKQINKGIELTKKYNNKYTYTDFLQLYLKINLFNSNDKFTSLSKEFSSALKKDYDYKKALVSIAKTKKIEKNSIISEISNLKYIYIKNEENENKNNTQKAILSSLIGFTSILLTCFLYLYNRFIISKKIKNKSITSLKTSLNSLDIFLSAISNDMKKPFHEIIDSSNKIISTVNSSSDNEDLKKHIKNLDQSTSQIYLLINNLLIWSTTQDNNIYSQKEKYPISKNITYINNNFPLLNIQLKEEYYVYANNYIVDFIFKTILNYIKDYSKSIITFKKQKKLIIITIQTTDDIFEKNDNLADLNFRLCKNLANINNGDLTQSSQEKASYEIKLSIESFN